MVRGTVRGVRYVIRGMVCDVWYVVRGVRMVWYGGATFVVVGMDVRTKCYGRRGAYPGIDMWWKVGEA